MSVKKQTDEEDLGLIVSFLNTARPGAKDRQWRTFTKKADTLAQLSLEEAINVRSEMHDALRFLQLDERQFKREEYPYADLVEQLSDLQMPTSFQCMKVKKGRLTWPGQTLLRSRDKRRWAAEFWPVTRTPKETLYGRLAVALIRGTLNHLKVCRHCGKYIVVRDIKREFCEGTNCKNDYFNHLKIRARKRRSVKTKNVRGEVVLMGCGCRTTWKGRKLINEELCEECKERRRQRDERRRQREATSSG